MNVEAFETFEVEQDDRRYVVELHYDTSAGAPWENQDFLGAVEVAGHREAHLGEEVVLKSPGERFIAGSHHYPSSGVLYDFAEAVAEAKKWVTPEEGETKGQAAVRLANQDMDTIRGWLRDDWFYVGVVVKDMTDTDCPCCAPSASLWCIGYEYGDENDKGGHIRREVLPDLIHEVEGYREAA
ncbi:MAG: hypothetical protein OXC91_00740 [Rhodobacteraceae bacterium]|nr:hypothetical protein [Paracoccaceae bacterium]